MDRRSTQSPGASPTDSKRSTSSGVTGEDRQTSILTPGHLSGRLQKILKGVGQVNGLSSRELRRRRREKGSWSNGSLQEWNLVSAGPSMMQVRPEDLLAEGMTVAVNRAISMRNRIPIDIWAVWDDPTRLFDLGYQKYVYAPLTIWLGPNRFQEFYLAAMGLVDPPAWEQDLDPLIGLRCMPWGVHLKDGHDLAGTPCKVAKLVCTLIYAIEKAVELGARHIRIFGADMVGSWSPGKTEEECKEKWGDRWSWERQVLRECIEAADAEEVFIEVL